MKSFILRAERPIETLAELYAFTEIAMQRWDEKAKQPSNLPLTPLVRVILNSARNRVDQISGLVLYYEETEPEQVWTDSS